MKRKASDLLWPNRDISNHTTVVSIDFGTARTGWAYVHKKNPNDIIADNRWPGQTGQQMQTPTNVLLTAGTHEFVAFGQDARNKFSNMEEKDSAAHLYFEKFKMCLYGQNMDEEPKCKATSGAQISALKVFSEALKYLKKNAMEVLGGESGMSIQERDVKWIVTVPAIWSEGAKEFMRRAAFQAGLISSEDDRMKIEFPSEPEAASVHCRDRELKLGTLKTGDIYLNLDLGGGTADMAVHQVDKDNNLTSLAVSGGKWGSCFIDEQFELWLHEVFTRTVVDTYKRENQQDYLDLMETFEQRKILFDPKSEDSIVVAFPSSFPDFVIEQLGKTTGQMIQEYTNRPVGPDHNEGKVDLLRGKLRLSRELMLKFFEVVVRPMIGEVRDLVTRHNCKYIFLVGAFGESEVVKARIRREFPGKRLVSPPRAGLAIVKGGARWGLEPSVISSRVLERSWGIEMWEEQQPADRKNGRITETDQDGTVRVARFKCFLRAGTTVKTGHAATHTIFMFNDSPTITLPVFTSGMVCTPRYPDECDDTFASLKLTAPPGQIIRDKEAFAITFQAGANEITAMARRKKTGHKVKCELNFMNFWSSDENA